MLERIIASAPEQCQRLVVVGFGMVAYKFVECLAALEVLGRYAVTIIGEEPHPAYDRVRLTEWLDHRDAQRLALGRPGWSEALGIRVITGNPVASIDRANHAVQTAAGEQIPYDRLVLATGSVPFVPPIKGADREGVFVYRTLDDLVRIRQRAADVRTVIVVGGGPLGLEAADALRRLGLEVVLLEAGPYLMSRQLDADAAALLETRVREAGVRLIAGVRARQIETRDGQQVLSIDGWVQPLQRESGDTHTSATRNYQREFILFYGSFSGWRFWLYAFILDLFLGSQNHELPLLALVVGAMLLGYKVAHLPTSNQKD